MLKHYCVLSYPTTGLWAIARDMGPVWSMVVVELGLHKGLHPLDLETHTALGAGHAALAAGPRHHVSTHVMSISPFCLCACLLDALPFSLWQCSVPCVCFWCGCQLCVFWIHMSNMCRCMVWCMFIHLPSCLSCLFTQAASWPSGYFAKQKFKLGKLPANISTQFFHIYHGNQHHWPHHTRALSVGLTVAI